MKSMIYSLKNLKRMTAFPYPLNEIGMMINHFAPHHNSTLSCLYFCFSFNKEKYNPAGTDTRPMMSILLPGLVLNSHKTIYHDELFFTYEPDVSQRLVEMLSPLPEIRGRCFAPNAEFNANLEKVRELLENRMVFGNADRLDVLALQILFSVIHDSPERTENRASMMIQEAASMIRCGVPLDQVIGECCMSRRTFYYEWKKIFSVSPKQMFLEHKLKEVQKLLLSTTLSISEIAEQCRFSSMTALHDCFVRHCGTTPGAYRLRWKTPE